MVNYIQPIQKASRFMQEGIQALRKSGDVVSKTTSRGATIDLIRGDSFDLSNGGTGFKLYKHLTKPSGERIVTNANVINGEIFYNELFFYKNCARVPHTRYFISPGGTQYATGSQVVRSADKFNPHRPYAEALILGKEAKNPTALHSGFEYVYGKVQKPDKQLSITEMVNALEFHGMDEYKELAIIKHEGIYGGGSKKRTLGDWWNEVKDL